MQNEVYMGVMVRVEANSQELAFYRAQELSKAISTLIPDAETIIIRDAEKDCIEALENQAWRHEAQRQAINKRKGGY
jgi:hypothetical protein